MRLETNPITTALKKSNFTWEDIVQKLNCLAEYFNKKKSDEKPIKNCETL
ncbi:hypothetical protein CFBP3846_04658 [Pseudomonas syringae pv. avii]|uniref:Uncharacterized protein n=2 Tax=Pseudomonas syringae group TaxID=136849 RepID=A0ABY1UCB8_PSESX|nr:hypothetical protein CFBP1573P_04672 [Pseudomonas syringae pv. persicae]SOQ13747.1 hypothetical protein NCPPB2254_04582 [Pseudomonas syringae pv. persicae]SOS29045.1 hypothetical protein CFBP3846_04658 [Pseudomonas syringae pv. avii]